MSSLNYHYARSAPLCYNSSMQIIADLQLHSKHSRTQSFKQRFFKIDHVLVIAFILFLPTQLGKHFFFDFSHVGGVRIDYLAVVFFLSDLLALFLFWNNRQLIVATIKRHGNAIVSLLLLFVVNILFSQHPMIGAYHLLKIVEFYFVWIVFSQKKLPAEIVFVPLLLGGIVELFLSIAQLYAKSSIQGAFYFLGERQLSLSSPDVATASINGLQFLRPYGTFSHPNSMAGFYLLVYFFTLSFFLKTTQKNQQLIFVKHLLLFVSAALVFLSFSKLAVTIFLLFILALLLFKKNVDCTLCTISRLGVALVLFLIVIVAKTDPLSLQKRATLLSSSLRIIKSHPVLGVGLGQYLYAQATIPNTYPYFFLQPVHNIFLLFLAQTGIVLGGVIVYIVWRYVWPQRKNTSFLLCLAMVVSTGMFDHYWLTLQQNWLLLPVVFGLLKDL